MLTGACASSCGVIVGGFEVAYIHSQCESDEIGAKGADYPADPVRVATVSAALLLGVLVVEGTALLANIIPGMRPP